MMKKATQKGIVDVTTVFWDIKRCPLPPDCDARLVGPRIKQYLADLGYSGPLSINAIGRLTDVPDDVLQAVSSTGIVLNHVVFNSADVMKGIYLWALLNRPPANLMVIWPYSDVSAKVTGDLQELGYNFIELFPCDSPYSETLWKKFLLEVSGTIEEDKCSETGEHASWVCSVCNTPGQGFESFTTHVKTHALEGTQMDKENVALTYVFWDIKRCPVPPDCDARLVAPCIDRYLANLGYSGPLIINAFGRLTDVPDDVLQAVSSNGIGLNHITFNIRHVMYQWASSNPPPANIMVICPSPEVSFSDMVELQEWGYNIIELFPHDPPYSESHFKNFLMEVSGTLEEDKCSETGEPASWVCSVCDIFGNGFESFTTHVKTREHALKGTRMDEVAVAVTSVFWDIQRCPVPPECDAHWVGLCIERYLEDLGYSGPLTINAVGRLTDVPDDVLQVVSSTGIDSADIIHHVSYLWTYSNPPPANIMVICPHSEVNAEAIGKLQELGYNIIVPPFPFDSPYSQTLWENLLLEGTREEDKCSETGEIASWVCSVCGISGKGFENFTTHVKTQEHALEMSGWIPPMPVYRSDEKDEDAVEAGDEGLLDSLPYTTMMLHSTIHAGNLRMAAERSECHEKYKEAVEAEVVSHLKKATTMVKKQVKYLKQPKATKGNQKLPMNTTTMVKKQPKTSGECYYHGEEAPKGKAKVHEEIDDKRRMWRRKGTVLSLKNTTTIVSKKPKASGECYYHGEEAPKGKAKVHEEIDDKRRMWRRKGTAFSLKNTTTVQP